MKQPSVTERVAKMLEELARIRKTMAMLHPNEIMQASVMAKKLGEG